MKIVDLYIDARQLVSTAIPGGTILHIANIPSGATVLKAKACADGTYHVRYSIEDEPPTVSVAIGDSHA